MHQINKEKIKKILTIASTGIGNVILYTPVIRSLKKNFPSAEIFVIVGSQEAREVLSDSNLVNKIMVLKKQEMNIIKYLKFLWEIRREKFDLVVTSFLDKSFKVGLFAFLTGAKYRVGFDELFSGMFYNYKIKITQQKHEVEYNLDLLRAIGLYKLDKDLFFSITEKEIQIAKKILNENNILEKDFIVGIHPGSGRWKRWPKEKYISLCKNLIFKYNAKIIIFGGKEEIDLANSIIEQLDGIPVSFCGRLNLKETAALIKMCKILIGNDTGLIHVASAVKVPVVVIFGPTLYWKNYPWNTKFILIRKTLPCSPCYNYKEVKCKKNFDCLNSITVEEVFSAVEKIYNEVN